MADKDGVDILIHVFWFKYVRFSIVYIVEWNFWVLAYAYI